MERGIDMIIAVCILLGIAVIVIIVLLFQLSVMRLSAREIRDAFCEKLKTDTNTTIDISARDKEMRALASEINTQLRILCMQRRRYQEGDLHLKEAVTNISHDLRTPLTAFSGYLDLIVQDKALLPQDMQDYLSHMQGCTEQMRALCEELFHYTYTVGVLDGDLSAPQMHKKEINLGSLLEETLLAFYPEFAERDITPEIQLPSEQEKVIRYLDERILSRIFSNIISNALKYSDGDFFVSLNAQGKMHFSNTARSLNAVTAGRLFDRYYTLETGRQQSGIGLSIARDLTQKIGGTISARYEGEMLIIEIEL